MTDAQVSQSFALAIDEVGGEAKVSQMMPLAVINYPSDEVKAQQALSYAVNKRTDDVEIYQAFAMVVVRGLPEWPICRAWTFTLDGHDFYVLNTVEETLVCDLSTEPPSWFVWGSGDSSLWRGWVGRQWIAKLPSEDAFGTNILVGDRVNGTLYFLNPQLPADDNPDFDVESTQSFRRVITGQVVIRGRTAVPCYGVELTGSPPQLYDDTLNTVELLISDDRGSSYVSCGIITVEENSYDQRFDWLSLGSMTSPGRLLQIVDYGALTRVDDLEIPDAAKS